jgi:hypothetical protein
MRLSSCILSIGLLASTVLSAPHNHGLFHRMERRARQGSSLNRAKYSSSKATSTDTESSSSIEYSENWSGAAITSPPSGQTFNAVSGTFTAPTPCVPSGAAASVGDYAASAWVGIDGNTYSTAILQTGVDFTVSSSGEVFYDAWYEWYPDSAQDFDLHISAGDVSLFCIYVH